MSDRGALKIALVILHADPARGGAERYTVDLAAALADEGHQVTLLAASSAEAFPSSQDRGQLYSVSLPAGGLTRLGQYSAFLDSIDLHLSRNSYDVVHAMLPVRSCDIYHPHAGLAVESLASGHRKRVHPISARLSQVGNHLNLKRRRFVGVERELLASPNPPIVLCLSQYVKNTVARHFALPDSSLQTLFNAVDLRRFDPDADPGAGTRLRNDLGIGADRVVGLMIAHDYFRKGLREAILATAEVRKRGGADRLTLLVVGKQDASEYRQLAADEGIAGSVHFVGPTDRPAAFFQAADFFVLPTRHDPCSLVVLEALAMGVPVISTVFNGACEIMSEDEHGYILPDPADVAALASAMGLMLDQNRRSRMRRACLSLRPALSFQSHVRRLEEIYRLPGPGRRAAIEGSG